MAGVYEGLDGVPAGQPRCSSAIAADRRRWAPTRPRACSRHDTLLFFAEIHRRADAARPGRGRGGRARGRPAHRRAGRGRRAHHHRARRRAADRARRPAAHRGRRRRWSSRARPSRSTTPACSGTTAPCSTRRGRAARPPPSRSAPARSSPAGTRASSARRSARRSCSWCRPPRATRRARRTARSSPTDTLVFVVDILDAQLIRQAGQPDLDDPRERGVEAAVRDAARG